MDGLVLLIGSNECPSPDNWEEPDNQVKILKTMVARDRFELPTRGFSGGKSIFTAN